MSNENIDKNMGATVRKQLDLTKEWITGSRGRKGNQSSP